ncbi:hypothetical protein NCC78_28990, partial [Micromonospora phytophila]|uniref:hypothetical protein n=1 Tax=Micromonospora phytophila TaxID=709888 RepID=UPI00202EC3D6
QPWLAYGLAVGALAVPVALVLRRRRHVPGATPGQAGSSAPAPGRAGPSAPAPDPEPVVDNVTRLPTDLNGIYELGRLDERLRQEREHRR